MFRIQSFTCCLTFWEANITKMVYMIEGTSKNVEKYAQQEKRQHVKLSTVPEEHADDEDAVFICGVTEKVSEALDALQSLKDGTV